MTTASIADLQAAHDEVVALVSTIPDAALDWQPDEQSWSLKRTLAHVTHAYAFYLMIVEEARQSNVGVVTLHPELPGWRRVEEADAAVLACATAAEICAQLNAMRDRTIAVLSQISPEELDRPFLLESWRPDVAPVTTTLRIRVLQSATDHLREHHAHISETRAQWRSQ